MASITITDVARRARVSMKTVSRVMNGEPYVREELRQRVQQAAKDLRYRPKVSARSLAGARAYVVGYLLTGLSPYVVQAQSGVLKACHRAGYHLMVEAIDLESPDLPAEMERIAGDLGVDGLILVPPLCDNTVIMDALDRQGVSYVRLAPAKDHDRSPFVEVDDQGAAWSMTRYLVGLGHRRIGFIRGPASHSASARRLQGFREGLAEARLQPIPELLETGDFTFETGRDAAGRLLALPEPPTAIFASNDVMACGAIAKARELGHEPPLTLSVSGFDDIPSASMIWPPLTTMRQPISEMAALAAEIIIARAAPGAPTTEPAPPFQCELVVRGSTAPPQAR